MSDVAALEAEVKEYKFQLETVVSGLQADPDNAELQNLQTELEEVISLTETAIAELKPSPAPAAAAPSAPSARAASTKEKWSKENHPAYQAGYRRPDDEGESGGAAAAAATGFRINDAVMAKWKSGDKAFYPAKITAITGASSKPIYVVTFRIDGSTDTLQAHEIRHMSNDAKKRKADAATGSAPPAGGAAPSAAVAASAPATAAAPGVIAAAASINPALASQARKEPSKVGDGPERPAKAPRKVKANKELEAGKSKWQEFTMKGGKMAKASKKDSMFRTGEGVNARVGFTGSGKEMRKDPARTRHKYNADADED